MGEDWSLRTQWSQHGKTLRFGCLVWYATCHFADSYFGGVKDKMCSMSKGGHDRASIALWNEMISI